MIATMKNLNHGNTPKDTNSMPGNKASVINPNHVIVTVAALIDQPAMTSRPSCNTNQQTSGARLTNSARTTLKTAFGSNGKTLSKITIRISAVNLMPPYLCQLIFEPTLTISAASATGDHAAEHHPKEVQTIPAAHRTIFTK
uniref:Uncharacterized protein n=1 Tax=Romanomermis culicivorax TaxID=13658 RepID=A0A915HRS6_ROMCU